MWSVAERQQSTMEVVRQQAHVTPTLLHILVTLDTRLLTTMFSTVEQTVAGLGQLHNARVWSIKIIYSINDEIIEIEMKLFAPSVHRQCRSGAPAQ